MTIGMIVWGPKPAPDGSPYPCTVIEPKKKWPYVDKCERDSTSMMPSDNFEKDPDLKEEFNLHGRIVCDFHPAHIDAYIADRNKTDPDYELTE